jgi:hypothetical protein
MLKIVMCGENYWTVTAFGVLWVVGMDSTVRYHAFKVAVLRDVTTGHVHDPSCMMQICRRRLEVVEPKFVTIRIAT